MDQPPSPSSSFIVGSYNILAHRFIKNPTVSWEDRRTAIVAKLLGANLDIILLQEVELGQFDTDFAALSTEYAHERHRVTKKRDNMIGNVILWRRNIFNLTTTATNSCSVVVELATNTQRIVLCNVHLKANIRRCVSQRLSQIDSCLKLLANVSPTSPVVICGDWNDVPDPEKSLVAKKLMSKEYRITSPGLTCYVPRPAPDGSIEHEYWSFDYVVSRGVVLEVTPTTLVEPIPNASEPSDHLMITFGVRF